MQRTTPRTAQQEWGPAQRAAYWREVVERYESSGLGIAAFCEREEIGTSTLRHWKTYVTKQRTRENPPRSLQPAPPSAMTFLPLEVREAGTAPGRPSYVVELAGGRRIRIEGGFDAAELLRLVRALETA